MRLLGVDFGSKRIGIAVGELEHCLASPRSHIQASGILKADAKNILHLALKEKVDAIVVGIPVQNANYSQKQHNICLRFASLLQEIGLIVYTINEAGTSLEVEQLFKELATKQKTQKKIKDSEAACRILERFFSEYEQSKKQ